MWNYPEGVHDSDFDDNEVRRRYREYVNECEAEGDHPMSYSSWLRMMEEDEE